MCFPRLRSAPVVAEAVAAVVSAAVAAARLGAAAGVVETGAAAVELAEAAAAAAGAARRDPRPVVAVDIVRQVVLLTHPLDPLAQAHRNDGRAAIAQSRVAAPAAMNLGVREESEQLLRGLRLAIATA